jgi:hypothetical protein
MNNLFKNTEWLGSITVMGISLSDLALLLAWLFVLIVYVGVQWPGRSEKNRSSVNHRSRPAEAQE